MKNSLPLEDFVEESKSYYESSMTFSNNSEINHSRAPLDNF